MLSYYHCTNWWVFHEQSWKSNFIYGLSIMCMDCLLLSIVTIVLLVLMLWTVLVVLSIMVLWPVLNLYSYHSLHCFYSQWNYSYNWCVYQLISYHLMKDLHAQLPWHPYFLNTWSMVSYDFTNNEIFRMNLVLFLFHFTQTSNSKVFFSAR